MFDQEVYDQFCGGGEKVSRGYEKITGKGNGRKVGSERVIGGGLTPRGAVKGKVKRRVSGGRAADDGDKENELNVFWNRQDENSPIFGGGNAGRISKDPKRSENIFKSIKSKVENCANFFADSKPKSPAPTPATPKTPGLHNPKSPRLLTPIHPKMSSSKSQSIINISSNLLKLQSELTHQNKPQPPPPAPPQPLPSPQYSTHKFSTKDSLDPPKAPFTPSQNFTLEKKYDSIRGKNAGPPNLLRGSKLALMLKKGKAERETKLRTMREESDLEFGRQKNFYHLKDDVLGYGQIQANTGSYSQRMGLGLGVGLGVKE